MFSDGIGARHGSLMLSSSHFACCTVIDADDHRERLVGREQAVAPGEQIALQPALAQMCSLSTSITRPSGATWSSLGRIVPTEQRFSTSKTSPSRFELVSSGQKRRKLRLRSVA